MNDKPKTKERPILFSAPMVRAILEGKKTQTRRVVKPQSAILTDEMARSFGVQPPPQQNMPVIHCRYGGPGERLWVRETWGLFQERPQFGVFYRADADSPNYEEENGIARWRPSIHMPRKYSRIELEIVSVRVERLQDITEADAIAEGIERIPNVGPMRAFGWRDYSGGIGFFDPVQSYRSLWESINGPDSWAANPWVWGIEFKRIKP